jgi:hypothetical protein
MNDGRLFVVVAESLRSGAMGLTILDEVRTSSHYDRTSSPLLPSVADAGAQVLTSARRPRVGAAF